MPEIMIQIEHGFLCLHSIAEPTETYFLKGSSIEILMPVNPRGTKVLYGGLILFVLENSLDILQAIGESYKQAFKR